MLVPLLAAPPAEWHCPNCYAHVWAPLPPPGQVKFHLCPGLHGLSAPLIRAGMAARVTAEERQEYLGTEIQATGDDGKPYMAVRTEHDDGHTDLAVNAGLARARLGDYR